MRVWDGNGLGLGGYEGGGRGVVLRVVVGGGGEVLGGG